METIELTARTLDEARKAAAERLGVSADQVELTVLEETKGLFGKSSLRVRASGPTEAPADAKPARTPRKAAEKPSEPVEEAKPAKPNRGRAARAATPAEEAAPAPEPVTEAPATDEAPKRGRRPARGKAAEAPAAEPAEAEAAVEEVVATQAEAEQLATMVREVLQLAHLEVEVKDEFVLNGRYVNLVLDGKDVAYLVGKHGEVLNAFQYLMNVMARQQMERDVRVTLDGNHYRERREEALTKLAVAIAEQVKERGEEAVLDALPAFERRVVHHALQELEGITTYSEGEEPNRRVVIAPVE